MKFYHLYSENFTAVSTEDMKKVLAEFEYIFGRSTYYVDKEEPYTKYVASPSSSQWGSKTELTYRVSRPWQVHVDKATCLFSIIIQGTTTLKRMESIGLGHLVEVLEPGQGELVEAADLGRADDLYQVALTCEELPMAELPFGAHPDTLEIMHVLYKHDVNLFPGMSLDIPGKYRIECGTHSCDSCGEDVPDQCWYSDFDGQLTYYADGEVWRFHVTCDGNLQLE